MTESACILYPFEVKHMLAAKRIKEKRKKKKEKQKILMNHHLSQEVVVRH